MAQPDIDLAQKYDAAAPVWADKMRVLGYADGYLGFLSAPGLAAGRVARVIDVGCGTGAFAEGWVAINGAPQSLDLLDPSHQMLTQAARALARRHVTARRVQGVLGEELPPADAVLAAHVLEHCPDPALGLQHMRSLLKPNGRLWLVVSKPHWCNALVWLRWRHRTFSRAELDGLFEAAGLRAVQEYSFPSGPPSRTSRGIVLERSDA